MSDQQLPSSEEPLALWPIVVVLGEIAVRVCRSQVEKHEGEKPNCESLSALVQDDPDAA